MKRLFLIGAVLLLGCDSKPEQNGSAVTTADSTAPAAAATVDTSVQASRPQYANAGGMMFDPAKIARGDTAAGLVVTSVDLTRAVTMPDSPYVGRVVFRGLITLEGNLMQHPDSDNRALCFEADSASAMRLPRMQGDKRRAWFCFRNQIEAAALLAGMKPPEPVRIAIDDFAAHNSFSDIYNTAKLVSVTKLKAP